MLDRTYRKTRRDSFLFPEQVRTGLIGSLLVPLSFRLSLVIYYLFTPRSFYRSTSKTRSLPLVLSTTAVPTVGCFDFRSSSRPTGGLVCCKNTLFGDDERNKWWCASGVPASGMHAYIFLYSKKPAVVFAPACPCGWTLFNSEHDVSYSPGSQLSTQLVLDNTSKSSGG